MTQGVQRSKPAFAADGSITCRRSKSSPGSSSGRSVPRKTLPSMLPAGPRGWSQGMVGGGIERRREPYRLGSVVEAGGRRYQSHERTEDDAEFLDVADGDGDAEHHHGRQPGDHECQQRDEQIRDCPATPRFIWMANKESDRHRSIECILQLPFGTAHLVLDVDLCHGEDTGDDANSVIGAGGDGAGRPCSVHGDGGNRRRRKSRTGLIRLAKRRWSSRRVSRAASSALPRPGSPISNLLLLAISSDQPSTPATSRPSSTRTTRIAEIMGSITSIGAVGSSFHPVSHRVLAAGSCRSVV